MKRKPQNLKNLFVHVRVTKAEKAMITKKANRAGYDFVSEYLLDLVYDDNRKPVPEDEE